VCRGPESVCLFKGDSPEVESALIIAVFFMADTTTPFENPEVSLLFIHISWCLLVTFRFCASVSPIFADIGVTYFKTASRNTPKSTPSMLSSLQSCRRCPKPQAPLESGRPP